MKYTKEVLEDAVSQSKSIANVLRLLNIKQSGGMHYHISNTIKKYNIDTSHFTGQGWNRGKIPQNKKSADDILYLLPEGSARPKSHMLKRALLEIGREYKCECCGCDAIWNNKPLTLQIDHIDGN